MNIEKDEWFSGIFGYNVFRIDLTGESESISTDIISDHFQKQEKAFYYSKVPTDIKEITMSLESLGFESVDVNVTYERMTGDTVTHPENGLTIREVDPGEREQVEDIARSSFVYSRFHSDPNIPNKIANEIKARWAGGYIENPNGRKSVVAAKNCEILGFLVGRKLDNQDTFLIDLVGVSKTAQRQGCGKRLVEHIIQGRCGDYKNIRVGTQDTNIPSVRLYEKLGFKLIDAPSVLHAHIVNGKVINEN
jgi:ribosomal protein S18 acetylase RimI-like enzyme